MSFNSTQFNKDTKKLIIIKNSLFATCLLLTLILFCIRDGWLSANRVIAWQDYVLFGIIYLFTAIYDFAKRKIRKNGWYFSENVSNTGEQLLCEKQIEIIQRMNNDHIQNGSAEFARVEMQIDNIIKLMGAMNETIMCLVKRIDE